MIRRLIPHPILTLVLMVLWVLLVNNAGPGHWVTGLVLGLLIPRVTAAWWPDGPRLRPGRALAYVALVAWDVIRANIAVTRVILTVPNARLRPAFVVVPLRLTVPEAITALMGTITLTPGTVSCDLSTDGRALLVHCLHAPDPDAVVAEIRDRYEARLLEIFA